MNNPRAFGQNEQAGAFVEVNGIQLYYEIYGKGEPLLLLHGTGQSISAFRFQIPYFEKHYQVIIADCRGRGRSTDTSDELTYELQASDISKFLDALQISSTNIVGWSDGGIIGIIMAITYPAKVKKLVAMGSNIHPEGLFPERLASHRAEFERLKRINNPENQILIKLYKLLSHYPKLRFEELSAIKSPTLIMAGDHDVIQDLHSLKIFHSIANAHLAIMPGETHGMPVTNPELFNSTVYRFLKTPFKKPERY